MPRERKVHLEVMLVHHTHSDRLRTTVCATLCATPVSLERFPEQTTINTEKVTCGLCLGFIRRVIGDRTFKLEELAPT